MPLAKEQVCFGSDYLPFLACRLLDGGCCCNRQRRIPPEIIAGLGPVSTKHLSSERHFSIVLNEERV